MPLADLGPRSLHYVRRGSGEPLLLVQGMSGHHGIWGAPFLSALERDFDVVAYDHRGIGDSTDVPGDFTIADLADDAAALLDVLAWPSAHVLGISMGGMVAQEIALRHPERVRGLVLGCTYAGGPDAALDAPGPLRMIEAMGSGDLDKAVRAGYEANLSPGFVDVEQNFPVFTAASLSVRVGMDTVMRQAAACIGHDASTRLSAVSAPTLVLHGDVDEMVLPANGVHVAGLIPGARLHTFPDTGHLFWWEHPQQTAALVGEHLLGR